MDIDERLSELEARIGAHQDVFVLMMNALRDAGADLRPMLKDLKMLENLARVQNLRSGLISELRFLGDQLHAGLVAAADRELPEPEDPLDG